MAFLWFLHKLVALLHILFTYTPTPFPHPRYNATLLSPPPNISLTAAHISAFMGFRPRISSASSSRGLKRRSLYSKRRWPCTPHNTCRRPTHVVGESGAASVSDKMEALKKLIPSHDEEINPDQLFQQTADYIVLLKTQVLVLQKLIDFYGSQFAKNQSSI